MNDASNATSAVVTQGGMWWTDEEMAALRAVLNEKDAELARLRAQLAECDYDEAIEELVRQVRDDYQSALDGA